MHTKRSQTSPWQTVDNQQTMWRNQNKKLDHRNTTHDQHPKPSRHTENPQTHKPTESRVSICNPGMLKHKPTRHLEPTKETKGKASGQREQDMSKVHWLSLSQAKQQPSNHLIQNHKAVTKQIKEISAHPLIYKPSSPNPWYQYHLHEGQSNTHQQKSYYVNHAYTLSPIQTPKPLNHDGYP